MLEASLQWNSIPAKGAATRWGRGLADNAWSLNATETGEKHWPCGRLGWNVDFGFYLLKIGAKYQNLASTENILWTQNAESFSSSTANHV